MTRLQGEQLAAYIDHTLLKPEARSADIQKVCEEARSFGFASVCVNSMWIPLASRLLLNCRTVPISVVGFPLGACATDVKAFETRHAIQAGAKEIDMVLAIGALKAGETAAALNDIREVVQSAGSVPVKVILEIALLTPAEIILASKLAEEAGAAFVKTSTGFGPGGATVEAVRSMRETVGDRLGVKASGGIRTYADAIRMIEAGANRLGVSASVSIIQESIQSKSESIGQKKDDKTGSEGSSY